MTVRDATPDDVPAMFEVRTLVDENHMSRAELLAMGITEDSVRAELAENLRGWVAEEDGRVVGFSLADRGPGTVWALFVLPEFHGRGHGTALLSRASEWLFEEGFRSIFLSTDPKTRAYRFYLRHGFRDVGEAGKNERRMERDSPRGGHSGA